MGNNRRGRSRHPNRLLLYRKHRKGLTQKQVAFMLGKSEDEISRYERGSRMPSLQTAMMLEIAYSTPIRALFKDLYDKLRPEIAERIKHNYSLRRIYADVFTADQQLPEVCTFKDILTRPELSKADIARVRDHITVLAKELAYS